MTPSIDAGAAVNIVQSAAEALGDWLQSYFRLLASLAMRQCGPGYKVQRQFAPLYDALLKEWKSEESNRLDFLRRGFLEFIGGHQRIRAADPRLMARMQEQTQMRYMTRAGLADALGVDPRTVHRILVPGRAEDSTERFYPVDSEGFSLTGVKAPRILNVRKASARMGVLVSLFLRMVNDQLFRTAHRLPGQAGYDEREV